MAIGGVRRLGLAANRRHGVSPGLRRVDHIQSTFNTGGASKTLSRTFNVENGDLVTIFGYASDSVITFVTPTWDGSGTAILQRSSVGITSPAARPNIYLWSIPVTAAATGRNITITTPGNTGPSLWGFTATVWRNHGGVGNTAAGTASAALAEYGFNEGSGLSTVDMSGNGHTLTASNTTTSWTASSPKSGAAAGKTEFTGYMGPDIEQQNYTVMAWVRREGTWSNYASWFANSNHFMFLEATSTNSYLPAFNAGVNSAVGTTAFALNTWTHIAATRASSGNSQIYVNGTLEGTATGNTWGQNFGAVAPGGPGLDRPSVCGTTAHTTNSSQWVGSVDDLRVFDYVLTAGEITAYMNTGLVGTTPGGTGSAPSLPLSVSANSAVEVGVDDAAAVDGTTRTWRTVNGSPMTEQLYFRQAPDYAAYGGYSSDAGAAGTIVTGLSAPGAQEWSAIGVEILRQGVTPPTSGSWLSGASGDLAGNGSFGTWRNRAVQIGGTWVNDPALYPFTAGGPGAEWATFNESMDVAVGPPTWSGWAAEATGIHDSFWTSMFAALATKRAGKGTTYVRPWWEFNGDWFDHSVRNSTDIANFKTAWDRMAGIARTQFPDVKLMIGAASSSGGTRPAVADCWPTAAVDVLSIDFYNAWPWVTTQAGFDDKIENGAGANSLEDLRRLAQSKGVPIAISEWSNQGKVQPASTGGGGESPGFIDSFYAWCTAHAGTGAGQLLYEVLFNLWDDQYSFYISTGANPLQPLTAAQYKLSTRFGG